MAHLGRKDIEAYPYGISLPRNFAQNILQLEEEMSTSCTISKIQTLILLYSSATEYYESIKDMKYKHYQDRIHDLLMKEEVVKLLQSQSGTPILPVKKPQKRKKDVSHRAHTARDSLIELEATKLVDEHFSRSSNVYKKLSANINGQYAALGNRILSRKNTINRSTTKDNYFREIEKVVEKFLKKKRKIKIRLKKKFADTELAAEYKKELDIELSILEDKKNQELKNLKKSFC